MIKERVKNPLGRGRKRPALKQRYKYEITQPKSDGHGTWMISIKI